MYTHSFDTLLGSMIALASESKLYLLSFEDCKKLNRQIACLHNQMNADIVPGITSPIASIQKEIQAYFAGELKTFTTPVHLLGTQFQQSVWHELINISYGQTRSYAEQAQTLGKPTAARAVANANGANLLSIIVPCHRIIQKNGYLGGYAAGIARKQWLLEHEKRHV